MSKPRYEYIVTFLTKAREHVYGRIVAKSAEDANRLITKMLNTVDGIPVTDENGHESKLVNGDMRGYMIPLADTDPIHPN